MEYRQLGRSGLRVSTLTLGTMTFGGKGPFARTGSTDVAGARRLIDRCVEAGVNMIDTANIYSFGTSEEILGEALGDKRDQVLIATKARMRIGEGANDGGLSRWHILRECENSLRRLKTDRIDLYFMHEWDGQTPLEETLHALDSLVSSGKVRYIGCSNYSAWHMMKALGVADARGYQRFVAQQIYYSLQAREAEYELIPAGLDQGVGVMVWSPLAGGLLSGKYRRGRETPEGRRLNQWDEPPVRDEEKLYDTIEVLVEIAAARGVPPAQVALAWLLGRPGVTALVIGARNEEQLAGNLGAADLKLSDEERGRLDAASAAPLIYPYWHQAATASDRLGAADLALHAPHVKR